MALESRLFQAGFSATLLWSAAIATVLLVPASPVRADVVTLVCQNSDGGGDSMTIRVDYDRKIVDLLWSDGTARYSAPATITEGAVTWRAALPNAGEPNSPAEPWFDGSLNRLSGQGYVRFPRVGGARGNLGVWESVSGPCRRATQKF